jgi:DNA recombination protein RmuC
MLLYIFLAIIIILLITILIFVLKVSGRNQSLESLDLKYKFDNLLTETGRIETSVKNEFVTNRKEVNESSKQDREELSKSLKSFEDKLNTLTVTIESKLKELNDTSNGNAKDNRKEIKEALDTFKNDFSKSVQDFNSSQKDNFFALLNKQEDQNKSTSTKLDLMRETIEQKVSEMQSANEKKLDEMRATVDEKLQKTLETRLGESFKLVSERLEAVHKGLGDMQQLATGVGDLKRVLTNVKSRGILGEYQLENILDQLLTLDQYAKNVKTKEGSNALVEFAVKLPGREDKEKIVWLPIDSKFPKEDFELLMDAYDKVAPDLIEEHRKNFVKGIKKCAVDIATKYIDPPNTTDFAILFLPFESLYAEVLRTPGLFEFMQREHKVVVTGPTTLSALLNSLQMGFKTLAIEKRSSEVWELLGAVKTEFGYFAGILEKTQKKLLEASNVIDDAGRRSRAIERKLKTVQELPKEQAAVLLGNPLDSNIEADDISAIEL